MAAPDETALRAEMCLWARSMFERERPPSQVPGALVSARRIDRPLAVQGAPASGLVPSGAPGAGEKLDSG